MGMALTLTVNTATDLEAIQCPEYHSCKGMTITIDNNTGGTLIIESLQCEKEESCEDLDFIVNGDPVVIEKCSCDDTVNSCLNADLSLCSA